MRNKIIDYAAILIVWICFLIAMYFLLIEEKNCNCVLKKEDTKNIYYKPNLRDKHNVTE